LHEYWRKVLDISVLNKAQARGNYYTQREIVAYMVDESLIAYFMAKLPDLAENKLRGGSLF
jgi:hypothetical protein